MNDKTEVGLGELAIAILEEVAGIGGDAVLGDRDIREGALTDGGAISIGGGDGHIQCA